MTAERYEWFRTNFSEFEKIQSPLFPSNWDMDLHFFVEYCNLTTQHITNLFDIYGETLDQNLFIITLKSTVKFENEMSQKFANSKVKRIIF